MNAPTVTNNTISSMIRNDDGVYEGDLKHYFRAVFYRARNLQGPYHNFRHMTHVPWLCYQACIFYLTRSPDQTLIDRLSKRKVRNLLIAGLFHDFDHTRMLGYDDINIELACRGLKKYILPEDAESLDDIIGLIKATEFPYSVPAEQIDLRGQIIRDADLSQALSIAWIQQVIFGLAEEWNMRPIDVLKKQPGFLGWLKYNTDWGKQTFGQDVLEKKVLEVHELLEILDVSPSFSTRPPLAT
jgi:hypothetical protein